MAALHLIFHLPKFTYLEWFCCALGIKNPWKKSFGVEVTVFHCNNVPKRIIIHRFHLVKTLTMRHQGELIKSVVTWLSTTLQEAQHLLVQRLKWHPEAVAWWLELWQHQPDNFVERNCCIHSVAHSRESNGFVQIQLYTCP